MRWRGVLGLRGAVALAILTAVSGCVFTGDRMPGRERTLQFDVAAFFVGRTQGRGMLKIATRRAEAVAVEGIGRIDSEGVIILEQSVQRGDRAATRRHWRLRSDGSGRYSGTLSDASGPVAGEVTGNVLHVRFAMKGGYRADQWLTLQQGGGSVRNVMIIRKFGVAVARLDETIVRLPA